MTTLTVCLMVKNEEGQLCETLNSVMSFADSITVLDTGSTDNTISEITSWCAAHTIPLYLKETTFVDFSVCRNELLQFAENVGAADWLLLLDAGDVVCGDTTAFQTRLNSNDVGFYIQQEWKCRDNTLKYFNIRCVKVNSGWHYRGVVHEVLHGPDTIIDKINNITLFQDRVKYGSKSLKRFETDYLILKRQVETDPRDARSWFYLAQTCVSLGKLDEGFEFYKVRSKMGGFSEEIFTSLLECGKCAKRVGDTKKALLYFLKSLTEDARAEPLVEISEIYRESRKWDEAFVYLSAATQLELPRNKYLFVDERVYTYRRWHIMGIVAYYCGKYNVGENACKRAIMGSKTVAERKLNESNLKFYIETKST